MWLDSVGVWRVKMVKTKLVCLRILVKEDVCECVGRKRGKMESIDVFVLCYVVMVKRKKKMMLVKEGGESLQKKKKLAYNGKGERD